jgi:DNA-directed RNA polymerase subunit RPC12/RpoP
MPEPTTQTPGMPCPECGRPILATLDKLLSREPIVCPCGLRLRVDEQRSQDVLEDLRELQLRLKSIRR